MRQPRLRVYYGPPEDEISTAAPAKSNQSEQITVPLSEIFPFLGEAVRNERTWLRDFEEDEITISTDLYEVILAYQHYRRPTG